MEHELVGQKSWPEAWHTFKKNRPEESKKIAEIILELCGEMDSSHCISPESCLEEAESYHKILVLLKGHEAELQVPKNMRDFAAWVQTICLCNIRE